MNEFPKYFNFDYKTGQYKQVAGPSHDHYTYIYELNAYYEAIIPDTCMEKPIKKRKR